MAAEIPKFLYGTAWKEAETERLTALALEQGFRGIDTANQRKHYFEAAVGRAVQEAVKSGRVRRGDLFLQTKFTFLRGQDHRLPYDPEAPIPTQVQQSFESSLDHLGTDYLDSYVLHGPSSGQRLRPADWQAWRAMEALQKSGKTRFLGVSNVNLEQLRLLYAQAEIPPKYAQIRCYASRGWERPIRKFCRDKGVVFQGFSLLTANRDVLSSGTVRRIAKSHGVGPAQVIFRFALDVGMVALTGTSNPDHMAADLAVEKFTLAPDEISAIDHLTG